MALSIHPLNVGDIELDASFLTWQTGCGTKVWAPATAWLILGGDKPILIDSSFRSVEDAKALQYLTCRRSPEQELVAQLAKYDVTPEQVGLLVHTHGAHGSCGAGSSDPNRPPPSAAARTAERGGAGHVSRAVL